MRLSPRTVEIIKNFSEISPMGMIFPEGNRLAAAPAGNVTIIGDAELDEQIEARFAIYDVVQLYSCITAYEEPELILDGLHLIIRDASKPNYGKFVLNTASETVIKEPPRIRFPSENAITFEMNRDMYSRILRGLSIVQAKQVAFVGDGREIKCTALDPENNGMGQFSVPLAESSERIKFAIDVEVFNRLLKKEDYLVSLTDEGVSRFQANKLTYYIAPVAE